MNNIIHSSSVEAGAPSVVLRHIEERCTQDFVPIMLAFEHQEAHTTPFSKSLLAKPTHSSNTVTETVTMHPRARSHVRLYYCFQMLVSGLQARALFLTQL